MRAMAGGQTLFSVLPCTGGTSLLDKCCGLSVKLATATVAGSISIKAGNRQQLMGS